MFIVWRRNVPKELIKIISVGHTTHNEKRNTRNVSWYIYKIFTDDSLRRLNCEVHATSTSLSILHSLPSLVEFQLIVNL